MAECPNCGGKLPENATRCLKCGAAVEAPKPPPQPQVVPQAQIQYQPVMVQPVVVAQPVDMTPVKSRILAGVLGILFGCLGVHNFYLGRTGIGVAQLLITVCTCGYGALATFPWAIIESILIFTGGIKDGMGSQLKA